MYNGREICCPPHTREKQLGVATAEGVDVEYEDQAHLSAQEAHGDETDSELGSERDRLLSMLLNLWSLMSGQPRLWARASPQGQPLPSFCCHSPGRFDQNQQLADEEGNA